MKINSTRIRLTALWLTAALLAPAAAPAQEGPEISGQGSVEAKIDFSILNYQETTNYGPLVSQLTTLFQDRIGDGPEGQAFEISKDANRIRVHVATHTDNVKDLKLGLRELATKLPEGELKDKLGLLQMEMSSSRMGQEPVAGSAAAPAPAGPERPGGEVAEQTGPAPELQAGGPRAMRLDLTGDPARSADKPHFKQAVAMDVPVQKLVWLLATTWKINFVVRPEAALRPVNIHLNDVDLDTLLKAVAESARIDIVRREAYYVVGGGLQP